MNRNVVIGERAQSAVDPHFHTTSDQWQLLWQSIRQLHRLACLPFTFREGTREAGLMN